MPTTLINLNSTTPPAPGGGLNVIFQNDSSNPINVSAYVVLSSIVAGSDTDVQVNSGGSLYADSGFTYNHTTGLVNITGAIFVGGPITIGSTNPASSGALRLENNQFISWRNAANNADLTAGYGPNDTFVVAALNAGDSDFASVLSTGTINYYGTGQIATVTYAVTSAANAIGATTVYTGVFNQSGNTVRVGSIVQILGFTNPSNNGFFYVVSVNGGFTQVTVNNSGGISESASATLEQWNTYKNAAFLGGITALGVSNGSITIGASAYSDTFAANPSAGAVGLILARGGDPLDITILDTFLTDQNNHGFQITAVTDGVGSTLYTFQMGLVGGIAGAFFNCNVRTPALVLTAATPTTTTGQLGIGTTAGVGNGTPGAVLAPAKGTGSGPATPGTIVNWLEIDIAGTKYWIPLAQ